MDTNAVGRRDEALSFLVNHDVGVLSTVSSGGPSSRLVYYTCDDSFNVFFITLANTRKVADLAANPRASFVVSEVDVPQTLQLEGTAEDITETAVMDPLLTDFIRRLTTEKKFAIPLEHLDSAAVRLYRLTPTWVRWGDFTSGSDTDDVLTQVNPAEEAT